MNKTTSEKLRQLLPAGATLYGIITHTARSGMSRRLRLYVVEGGRIRDITFLTATALRSTLRNGEMVVNGCGFDPICQVAYDLTYALFGPGKELQLNYEHL